MDRKIVIATGRSRKEMSWQNKTVLWSALKERLSHVKRTGETERQYKAMKPAERGRAKDVGGFVGGRIEGGRRKAGSIVSRSLLTLDIDFCTGGGIIDRIRDALGGHEWCLYSTHSHAAGNERYRLVTPLSEDITADEYVPVSRRVAERIGIESFDPSTYEPHRLMYWPSCPSDGEFVYEHGEGSLLDPHELLDTYDDWRDAREWPGAVRGMPSDRKRQADPLSKDGVIGAFCRTYGMRDILEGPLKDIYEPTGMPDRYTFRAGTTSGGVIVYDDRWAFSHHGTDPAGGRLCNAFDLMRIHRFGDLDENSAPDTPANRLPSYKAMEDYAVKDVKVRGTMAGERMKALMAEFGDDIGEGDEEDSGWMTEMQTDGSRRGNLLPSPYNFRLILEHDRELIGLAYRDEFCRRDIIGRSTPWGADEGDVWRNTDDNGLVDYVSRKYKLTGKDALMGAFDLVTSRCARHPVREYLESLTWDGVPRLDTLLVRYMGASDCELTRAMTRKHLVAAVARIFSPGIKYDNVLTLVGEEGTGKSTLIKILGGRWFDDSLVTIEGKEGMESIQGKWLIEIGELTSYKKSTSEMYKAFLSKREDSYRPAYARRVEVFPRQCVFFATTNERAFLKGDTGNRRFWVVECGEDLPDADLWSELPQLRDQIWAEAVAAYRAGEKLYLDRRLEMAAKERQETHNEVCADERMELIREFIRRPIRKDWYSLDLETRASQMRIMSPQEDFNPEDMICRKTITAVEILAECFHQKLDDKTRYRTREINQMLRNMKELRYVGNNRIAGYGKQRQYEIIPEQ